MPTSLVNIKFTVPTSRTSNVVATRQSQEQNYTMTTKKVKEEKKGRSQKEETKRKTQPISLVRTSFPCQNHCKLKPESGWL